MLRSHQDSSFLKSTTSLNLQTTHEPSCPSRMITLDLRHTRNAWPTISTLITSSTAHFSYSLHNRSPSSCIRHKYVRSHSHFPEIVAWPSCAEHVQPHGRLGRDGISAVVATLHQPHYMSQEILSSRQQTPAAGESAKCGSYVAFCG